MPFETENAKNGGRTNTIQVSSDSESTTTSSDISNDSDSDICNDDRQTERTTEAKSELSTILGENPNNKTSFGPELAPDLANRWSSYIMQGLDKETITKIFDSVLFPSNCSLLEAPKNNPEVEAMIPPTDVRRDKFLMSLQNQLGKSITALGNVMTNMLQNVESNTDPDPNLVGLVDAGKMLCSIHHLMSTHRKYMVHQHFNKKMQLVAMGQSRDSMLFGDDFAEKCKSAKNLETLAKELKSTTATSSNYLKGHASRNRWRPTDNKKRPSYSYNKPTFKTNTWNKEDCYKKGKHIKKQHEWNGRR
ncbi:unnamed protein product [Acanthoscelides obtectus]|uniref:Uncharacterized protein n=1 Tax=Acanthoscelides obtectus TaxID=200917 RepID=A0A9P0Q1Q6_ACAOB|nr:unnamed protein product [Acanthoscelides obtectus]CAK1650328.1 hypothetical protein AOBTE_LOCUS16737 [Acanthoscelides obtectus]